MPAYSQMRLANLMGYSGPEVRMIDGAIACRVIALGQELWLRPSRLEQRVFPDGPGNRSEGPPVAEKWVSLCSPRPIPSWDLTSPYGTHARDDHAGRLEQRVSPYRLGNRSKRPYNEIL